MKKKTTEKKKIWIQNERETIYFQESFAIYYKYLRDTF